MQKQANLLHLFSIESWLERKRLSIVISHHLSSSLVRVDNICEPCICATEDTFWPGASCPCTDRFPGQCTFFFFTTTNALDGGTLQLWKCLCASKTKRNAVYRTDPYCIPRFYGFISPTYIVNWWRIVRHNSDIFWSENDHMLGLAMINQPLVTFFRPPTPKRMTTMNHQCGTVSSPNQPGINMNLRLILPEVPVT